MRGEVTVAEDVRCKNAQTRRRRMIVCPQIPFDTTAQHGPGQLRNSKARPSSTVAIHIQHGQNRSSRRVVRRLTGGEIKEETLDNITVYGRAL